MKLVEINRTPSNRQLRQFGVVCSVAVPLLGRLSHPPITVQWILLAIAISVLVVSYFRPQSLRPIFVSLMLITAPIGMIVSELALLTIYFGLFLPFAMFFKLVRRDALQLKLDRTADTYWQEKVEPQKVERYYRQY
jgi:hypothetical protein